jgi:prolyl-tRNA editing enzyme YbaK/EbsC (Cys-tRNA(Pro) deacylase)
VKRMTRKMVVDLVTAKTMAVIQGMFLGKERVAKGIILEVDANQIVMAVNSGQPCNNIYGHFTEDI